jgi:hypothetical protein
VVTLKPRKGESVTGRVIAVLAADSLSGPSDDRPAIVLRVGWKDQAFPLKEIRWIQDPQGRAPVLIAFGAGLVVDLVTLYIIFMGWDGIGN